MFSVATIFAACIYVETTFLESEDFDAKESETSYLWLYRTSNTNLVVYLWIYSDYDYGLLYYVW